MKILNATKNMIIAPHGIEANNLTQKVLGLTTYKKPQAMIFTTRFGIHTIGMKYPIDVVVLDKNNIVVKIREHLQPNSFFMWHPKYKTVIELPSGTISATRTEKNDHLTLL
jgi:uncharacterized protein